MKLNSCKAIRTAYTAPIAALLLSGCATIPDLGDKPAPISADRVAADQSLAASSVANWPADEWWKSFGDSQLDGLIAEGVRNSPDVAGAAARFRRAGGVAQQAGASLLPSVSADGSAGWTRQSLNMGYPDEFKQFLPRGWKENGRVAANIGFDLDLWGKNRAALAAATSEERAAAIDVHQARLMLTTGIASAYADLARLEDERKIRENALNIRTSSQRLISDRMRNGLETRGSLRQTDANVASARADLSATEQALAIRRHQIAALIGAGPDRGLTITAPALAVPATNGLPAGVTTDLIGRRPDVAAARERVEAAAKRIKVARADFFPAVNLSALIGLQSIGLGNLIEKDATFGSVGPAISLPIFHGGALQGQYRVARANFDEAVADYDKAVLTAYQEVADAATATQMIDRRLIDARAAVKASEEAYAIAQGRYRGGLSNYLDVLTVEDRLLQSRMVVAGLEAAARTAQIELVRALGGGFQATDMSKDANHG